MVAIGHRDTDAVQYGWLDWKAAPRFSWLEPQVNFTLYNAFDFGTGWGGVIELASVQLTRDPLSQELREVYSTPDLLRTPVGDDGTLFWTEGGVNYGQVMVLDRNDDTKVVAKGDWFPINVGISSRTIAWVGTTGERVTDGFFETANLYFCERPEEPGPCEVSGAIRLPIQGASGGTMEVRDPWVAITACDTDTCGAYLANMETERAYRLRYAEGVVQAGVIGFSSREFFVFGFSAERTRTGMIDSFWRYEISKLTDYADEL